MNKLIFLDTEATGNDTAKDRLCQVCYKTEEGIFTEYFKPPIPVSIKAMSITNITNKMLEDKPAFKDGAMNKALERILPDGILVAHNAKFDIAILEAEGIKVPNYICTFRVARGLDTDNVIPEYNLQYLRYYLELDVEATAHDAEGDVKILHALFNRLLDKMKKEGASEEQAIANMIDISSKPLLFKLFNFGKYKGQSIEGVAKFDRRYLEWLLSKKMEDGGQDEDWVFTLKFYLNN